ncbi:peptidyl-alpha-hydroxyglycine alpha-amidating lyase family protein [soil metagenome]
MRATRREFLAAAAAAPIISPTLLNVQDKAGVKAPVMGEGAYTYEAIHDWGQLPPQIKWGNTHGVVEDAQGNIHIHHTVHATSDSADTVVVFDPAGKFVRSWGKEFRGVAHGLHLQKEGGDEFLYLTVTAAGPKMTPQPEMHSVVVKATLKGDIVWKIQGPPDVDAYKPGPDEKPRPYNPTNLAIGPTGDVYVGDGYGSYYINQYTGKGEYIRSFGGRGSEPGQLLEPHGIWLDTRGGTTASQAARSTKPPPTGPTGASAPVLVVADRRNNRLQRFSLDGTHLDFIPGFRLPCHFDQHEGLLVVPDLHGRVTLVDSHNMTVAHLGDSGDPNWNNPLRREPREKFIPGRFICPHGACFDRDGNIYVVEWVEVGRVTKLRKVA